MFFLSKTLFVRPGKIKYKKYRLIPKTPSKRNLNVLLIKIMKKYLQGFMRFEIVEQKDKFLVLANKGSFNEMLSIILLHVSIIEEKENFCGNKNEMDSKSR